MYLFDINGLIYVCLIFNYDIKRHIRYMVQHLVQTFTEIIKMIWLPEIGY